MTLWRPLSGTVTEHGLSRHRPDVASRCLVGGAGTYHNDILVLHGWGSALGLNHTARFAEQIKSIASQDQPIRASAWVRSATMSSTCSMPMEARMVASEIPRRSRVSRGTPECTVVAGWQTKDSVPPRLTASLKTCSALSTAKASASPPRTSNAKVLPAPVHWR